MERARSDGLEALFPADAREVNRVCERYEAAWRAGAAPRIEEWLGEAAEATRPALFTD